MIYFLLEKKNLGIYLIYRLKAPDKHRIFEVATKMFWLHSINVKLTSIRFRY